MSGETDLLDHELINEDVEVVPSDVKTNKMAGVGGETPPVESHTDVKHRKRKDPPKAILIGVAAVVLVVAYFLKAALSGSEPVVGIEQTYSESAEASAIQSEQVEFDQSEWGEETTQPQVFVDERPADLSADLAENTSSSDVSDQGAGGSAFSPQVSQSEYLPNSAAMLEVQPALPSNAEVDGLKLTVQEQSLQISRLMEELSSVTQLVAELKASIPDGDYASKRAMLDALAAIKALQAQDQRFMTSIKRLQNQEQAAVNKQPTGSQSEVGVVTKSAQEAPGGEVDNKAVIAVKPTPQRVARDLMWSSYIEDYGMAVIDGTTSLVELSPGQTLLGRGVIRTITGSGCIVFTDGDKYAPTNGECL